MCQKRSHARKLPQIGCVYVSFFFHSVLYSVTLAYVKIRILLVRYNELEEWQKDNEFIHGWYRAPLYSFKNCFRSCFRWHNETINIWVVSQFTQLRFNILKTHFLPSVFFAVFLVTHSSMSSESFVNQLEEKQIIGLFGLGSEWTQLSWLYKIGAVHLIESFLRLAMSLPFGTVSYIDCALEKNSIDLQQARLLRDNSLDHG